MATFGSRVRRSNQQAITAPMPYVLAPTTTHTPLTKLSRQAPSPEPQSPRPTFSSWKTASGTIHGGHFRRQSAPCLWLAHFLTNGWQWPGAALISWSKPMTSSTAKERKKKKAAVSVLPKAIGLIKFADRLTGLSSAVQRVTWPMTSSLVFSWC